MTSFALLGALARHCRHLLCRFTTRAPAFSGLIQCDAFSVFFHCSSASSPFSWFSPRGRISSANGLAAAEFYALVLFATAGMGVLASAQELLTAFIGLEMSSISSYILAGYRRDSLKSSESAMKYFLLGSFATAFFLYGIALVYGATGTTNLLQDGCTPIPRAPC